MILDKLSTRDESDKASVELVMEAIRIDNLSPKLQCIISRASCAVLKFPIRVCIRAVAVVDGESGLILSKPVFFAFFAAKCQEDHAWLLLKRPFCSLVDP